MLPLTTPICYFARIDTRVTARLETLYKISLKKTAVFLDRTPYSLVGKKSSEQVAVCIDRVEEKKYCVHVKPSFLRVTFLTDSAAMLSF
jgi:hypothetical protein